MTLSKTITVRALGLSALLAGLVLPATALHDHEGQKDKDKQERAEKDGKKKRGFWRAKIGKAAPSFELQDLEGQTWKLSDHKGKTVVLEWFNPDCPIVVNAYKDDGTLKGLGSELHAADDVVWVAINSGAPGQQGTGLERNQKAARDYGMAFPVLLDEAGWVGAMYGATTTPHMYVIDAEGKLVYVGSHGDGKGENPLVAAIEDVRAGREVATPETKNFGCSVKYVQRAELGHSAPPFTLVDTEGQEHSLRDHLGKVVVLEWINPDCPIVVNAYKDGATLAGFGNGALERGVAWFAINSGAPGKQGAGVERNQRAREQWSLAYPVLLDEQGNVGRAYGATTTPHMYIIDERGVLVYMGGHDDGKGASFIDPALTAVLAGRPVENARTRNYGCAVKYAAMN